MYTLPRTTLRPHALLLFFAQLTLLHAPSSARAADTTPPKITKASISPTGTYGASNDLPNVTITATITDPSGVNPNSVFVNVYINGSISGLDALQLSNGGSGSVYTVPTSLSNDFGANTDSVGRVFTFVIQAQDNAGNTATVTAAGSITQTSDTTPPTVTNASFSPTGTYGAIASGLPTITITATVTDTGANATGVEQVLALLFLDGSPVPGAYLSNGGSGNVYTGTLKLYDTIGLDPPSSNNNSRADRTYTVQIFALDHSSNRTTANAAGSIIQLHDNIPPKITNAVVSPKLIARAGGTVTLSANVTDSGGNNTGVGDVQVEVYKDGTDMGYSDLNNTTGSTWFVTRDIPAGDGTPHLYKFVFTATDNVGNVHSVTRSAQQAGVTPSGLSISPATVTGGSSTSTGTITLSGPAPPSGLAVTQTSSDTSAATLAPTLNIPAGATSAKFKITTKAVMSTQTVTITSSVNGLSKTATLTVTH